MSDAIVIRAAGICKATPKGDGGHVWIERERTIEFSVREYIKGRMTVECAHCYRVFEARGTFETGEYTWREVTR